MLTGICLVTEAAEFAARRHTGMARKGRGNEPYVNHLAEVAHFLAVATDGADAELVAAGWRRKKQIEDAPHKSPDAKLVKIADKISNVSARILPHPSETDRDELADYVAWAEKVVAGCRGVNAMLDRTFDTTAELARSTL
ncbi:phosphohydrolase [Bradyrhizobium sp. URHC0002]